MEPKAMTTDMRDKIAKSMRNSGRTCDEDNWHIVMADEAMRVIKPYIKKLEGDNEVLRLQLEAKRSTDGKPDSGYVMVPREPTYDMCLAASNRDDSKEDNLYEGIYRAMIQAATQEGGEGE